MEELENSVESLMRENFSLKKQLRSLSEVCVELTDSNDSIEVCHLNPTFGVIYPFQIIKGFDTI